jgi:single-strand DNA-binding protein
MNDLNSILIEGNLVRDPESSYTPTGVLVCKFTVASNRFFKVDDEYQKEVSFFSIQTWAKLAETCVEVLKKGHGVRVVGRIKQDRWTDTKGNVQSKIEIIAEHVEFKHVGFIKSETKAGVVKEELPIRKTRKVEKGD